MKRKIKVLFLLLLAISTFLSFTIQSLVYAVEEGEQAESGGGDGGGAGGDGGGDGGIHFSGDYINDNTDSSDDGGNDENGDDGKCTTCGNEPQDNNNTNTGGGGSGEGEEKDNNYSHNDKVDIDKLEEELIHETKKQEGEWECTATSCSLDYGVSQHSVKVKGQLYDMFNEPLTSKFGVLAGTHIGANLCEMRKAVYYGSGSMNYSCKRNVKYQVCDITVSIGKYGTRYDYVCHYETRIETRTASYPDSGCTEAALRGGYQTALSLLSGEELYTVDISDPNEAECYDKPDGYKYGKEESQICKTYHAVAIGGTATSYKESKNKGNTVIKNYCYELYGSCINVKTGMVEYLTEPVSKEDENPCRDKGDEWYYVKNDYKDESDRHWHIFIPLNAKETNDYQFSMKSKTKEKSSKLCAAIIKKYSKNYEYTKYIVPAIGSFNKNKSDINLVKNGCYYKSTINVSLRQRFYNEVASNNKDTSELIGFNFYYRPISLDNPFPNGITKYSDWEKWNENKKQGKENPELDKSFNTITYAAANINLSYIRNYNKENLYTDWSKMNIDGSSTFIQKDNIIDRNGLITNKTFYSLGCGIENQCEYLDKEQKIKNPIYQPRCKNNKTNDTCPTSSYK